MRIVRGEPQLENAGGDPLPKVNLGPSHVPNGAKMALREDASIILIKQGGLGDYILMTPALRALRARYPRALIDILVSGDRAKEFLQHYRIFDEIAVMPKELLKSSAGGAVRQGPTRLLAVRRRLHGKRYDVAVSFDHFIPEDASFFSALMIATGARQRVGLDCGTTEGFFDVSVPDCGFGVRHEAEYQMAVAEVLDAPVIDLQPSVPIDEEARDLARTRIATFVGDASEGPLIAMHPGCFHAYPARRWPPEQFAATADRLHARFGGRLLLLGGPEELEVRKKVRDALHSDIPCQILCGEDSLLVTGAILKECDLFIGNDSGLMHLAAAVMTPTIGIFGLSNPRAWSPFIPAAPARARAVYRDLACRPCNYVGLHSGDQLGCQTRDCLIGLDVESVLAAAHELLSVPKGDVGGKNS